MSLFATVTFTKFPALSLFLSLLNLLSSPYSIFFLDTLSFGQLRVSLTSSGILIESDDCKITLLVTRFLFRSFAPLLRSDLFVPVRPRGI